MARRLVRKTRLGGNAGAACIRSSSISTLICTLLAVGVLFFVLMDLQQLWSMAYIDGTLLQATNPVPDDASIAAITATKTSSSITSMKEWRTASIQTCQEFIVSVSNDIDPTALEKKEQLERSLISQLTLPTKSSPQIPLAIQQQPYRRCKNVFIDLGTNIGDSVGYFTDNAIDLCSPVWAAKFPKTEFNADFPRPHLNVSSLQVEHKGNKGNPLFVLLQKQAGNIPSESFCVYGMEGNPTFTRRLRQLENFIREIQPSIFQHVHIFTESVVTAQDGPTKLYLDKISVEQNVRKSVNITTIPQHSRQNSF
jgi:hypothetical protein